MAVGTGIASASLVILSCTVTAYDHQLRRGQAQETGSVYRGVRARLVTWSLNGRVRAVWCGAGPVQRPGCIAGGENAHFAFFYDESLSHLIYAGCDIIAVPSMFEPCGLTQVTSHDVCCHPVLSRTFMSAYS